MCPFRTSLMLSAARFPTINTAYPIVVCLVRPAGQLLRLSQMPTQRYLMSGRIRVRRSNGHVVVVSNMSFHDLEAAVRWALGADDAQLTIGQMGLRAAVIYVVALVLVRLSHGRRLFGNFAAFDVILSIIIGSVLSRAVNVSAPFFATLATGGILLVLHWLFVTLAFHTHKFGKLLKGSSIVLVRNGMPIWDTMRKNAINERDILESLRINAHLNDMSHVREARIERSGDSSSM